MKSRTHASMVLHSLIRKIDCVDFALARQKSCKHGSALTYPQN